MKALDSGLMTREVTSDVDALELMIEWVEKGHWCRNKLVSHQYSNTGETVKVMCALGMIGQATKSTPYTHDGARADRIKEALVATIGEDYPAALVRGARINDGISRGHHNKSAKIATYNNTRLSERDIAGWFRRARRYLGGS